MFLAVTYIRSARDHEYVQIFISVFFYQQICRKVKYLTGQLHNTCYNLCLEDYCSRKKKKRMWRLETAELTTAFITCFLK
jgi:hypothetical protein